jgi:hypothetical protein
VDDFPDHLFQEGVRGEILWYRLMAVVLMDGGFESVRCGDLLFNEILSSTIKGKFYFRDMK